MLSNNWVFAACFVTSVIALMVVLLVFLESNIYDDIIMPLLLLVSAQILCFWVIMGNCIYVDTRESKVSAQVVATDQSVVLLVKGKVVKTITDYETCVKLREASKVDIWKREDINMYNNVRHTEYELIAE